MHRVSTAYEKLILACSVQESKKGLQYRVLSCRQNHTLYWIWNYFSLKSVWRKIFSLRTVFSQWIFFFCDHFFPCEQFCTYKNEFSTFLMNKHHRLCTFCSSWSNNHNKLTTSAILVSHQNVIFFLCAKMSIQIVIWCWFFVWVLTNAHNWILICHRK